QDEVVADAICASISPVPQQRENIASVLIKDLLSRDRRAALSQVGEVVVGVAAVSLYEGSNRDQALRQLEHVGGHTQQTPLIRRKLLFSNLEKLGAFGARHGGHVVAAGYLGVEAVGAQASCSELEAPGT